jgi:peptidoglycan/LPS O-acetylase OafA/YrhL
MIERTQNRFDVLRLLAALCVLISHAYPISGQSEPDPFGRWVGLDTLGGVGVIIFFVLSGYLVTLSWERSADFLDFAWRRAVRIYPALLVLCVLTVFILGPAVTEIAISEYWRSSLTWRYLETITGINIQYTLPGVFTKNSLPNALNGSLWSLPYEINCYIALILLSIFRGNLKTKTGLSVILLAAMILQHPGHPPGNPFATWMGVDYYHAKLGLPFAIGAFFAATSKSVKPRLWYAFVIFGMILLPSIGASAKTLLFLSGTSILSLHLALKGSWIPKPPESLGDWSYGVYLYGFPVQQVLAHAELQKYGLLTYISGCTVVTISLAAASWFFIEKPALKLKTIFSKTT